MWWGGPWLASEHTACSPPERRLCRQGTANINTGWVLLYSLCSAIDVLPSEWIDTCDQVKNPLPLSVQSGTVGMVCIFSRLNSGCFTVFHPRMKNYGAINEEQGASCHRSWCIPMCWIHNWKQGIQMGDICFLLLLDTWVCYINANSLWITQMSF